MKPAILIVILLTYAFVELPFEIIDNLLTYLIPFIISIFGIIVCVLNFYFIKTINSRYKKFVQAFNILTVIVYSFLTIYNFPIPERSGMRCKNWTDISMLINLTDHSEQYVFQSMEISGSIYSHRQVKVKPINSWLRWSNVIKRTPQKGTWLFIDNSNNGENAVPFPLDNSKINFENDCIKAEIVILKNGQIMNNIPNI